MRSKLMFAGLALLAACGTVRVTKTVDGKRVTEEHEVKNLREFGAVLGREVADPYVQMGKAFKEAGQELQKYFAQMIKEIREVPEPGAVKLSDLDPALAQYEGSSADFLRAEEVTYVRIGVPSYDDFFRASSELYAYTHQLHASATMLRESAAAKVGKRAAAKMSVQQLVASAEADDEVSACARALTGSIAGYRARVANLKTTGQQLAGNARASLTNPRVIAHVALIVKGVRQSVKVIGQSGKLLTKISG